MTFRVKSGRVEAEKSATANSWAGQCQSKVCLGFVKRKGAAVKMFLDCAEIVEGTRQKFHSPRGFGQQIQSAVRDRSENGSAFCT